MGGFYLFVFLDGRCANALPAAVFDFALVLPSRSTADAALAALADVCFEFFITQILLSTNTKNRKGAHLTTKKIHSKIRCKQILYEFRLGSRQT